MKNKLSTNYDKYYPILYKFHEKVNIQDIEILKNELDLKSTDISIDLGCGYGRLSNILLDDWFNVIWLDFSNDLLEIAKQNSIHKEAYRQWDFYKLSSYFQEWEFDKAYSMYTAIWTGSHKDDLNFFKWVWGVLKKWWLFILEYENFTNQLQSDNLSKNTFSSIGSEFRRIMTIKTDLVKMKKTIDNELWDIKNEKKVKEWSFSLHIYTYEQIIKMWAKYWLKIKKIRGRIGTDKIFSNEAQVLFIFEKD